MADFKQAGALIAANRLAEARATLTAARKLQPEASFGLFLDGVLTLREGRGAEALAKLGEASRRPDALPNWALTYGFALDAAGRTDDAVREYEAAARRNPQLPEPWYCLGVVRARQARWPDAEQAFQRTIERDPGRVEALHQMALARNAQGRPGDAIAALRQALAIRPGYVAGVKELALLLARSARHAEAIEVLSQARARGLVDAELLNNLGFSLQREGRHDEALAALREAVSRDPQLAPAHCNLGTVHHVRAEFDAAIASYRAAIALDPDYAEPHVNLALALWRKKDREAMRREMALAAASRSTNAEALHNLAQLHLETGDRNQALALHREALAVEPGHAGARLGLALALLARGEWAEGWEHYRHRATKSGHPLALAAGLERFVDTPLPADLSGRRFTLVDEQGLGDVIFFMRFAPVLLERGAQVQFQGDERLGALLDRTGLFSACVPRGRPLDPDREPIFLPDLPRLLGWGDGRPLPPPIPLQAESSRSRAIAARLAGFGPGPYVGLGWRAGIRPKDEWIRNLYKEVPLDELGKSLAGSRASWVCLQRNPDPGEVQRLAALLGKPVLDLSGANDDLEEAVAVLAGLDAYAAVSNTNTHLYASLGKSPDVLVAHPAEWRWMQTGASPWYPTARLHREQAESGWQAALEGLRAALRHAIAS